MVDGVGHPIALCFGGLADDKHFTRMKGDAIMEPVLKRDVERLLNDTERVEQGLEVLEKDHAVWAGDREREDVLGILEGVKGLEYDVSTLMGDCVSSTKVRQRNVIMGDFNQAFKGLNVLFEDFKTVRKQIDQSYTSQRRLEQTEIDWSRFRKTVEQIQKDIQQGYQPMEGKHIV